MILIGQDNLNAYFFRNTCVNGGYNEDYPYNCVPEIGKDWILHDLQGAYYKQFVTWDNDWFTSVANGDNPDVYDLSTYDIPTYNHYVQADPVCDVAINSAIFNEANMQISVVWGDTRDHFTIAGANDTTFVSTLIG